MKNKVIYLPFENLPQRYTKMWNDSFIAAMSDNDIAVWGDTTSESVINKGEFLDICDTISYKQMQIANVAKLFKEDKVQSGDVFFVPDIFYPSLASIRYMSELLGIDVKIVAFNHAGRADKDDFVQRLGTWSDTQEQAWHDMCDLVLVGSEYHGKRVRERFAPKRIETTGAIWSKEWMDEMCKGIDWEKEDYIIFPHRPCKEKRFTEFLQVARSNPRLHFVVTSSGNNRLADVELPENVSYMFGLSKRQYFQVFASAKGYLSLAAQETFGYTLQEAIYFNCDVVVPKNACYEEYAHPSSVFPLEVLMQKGKLTSIYSDNSLSNSKNVADNAASIYQLCKEV